jgi:hypothetical protein
MDRRITRTGRNGSKTLSKQPRFRARDPQAFFNFLYDAYYDPELIPLAYGTNSMARDEWLIRFVRKEPNLEGVLTTVVDIDKNRGWRMVGGRNQVNRFTTMLHEAQVAPGLTGWRAFMTHASQAYWGTDMGSVTELGREGKNGPVRQIFAVDPTKCELSGDPVYPLNYYPSSSGRPLLWRASDFVRATSMNSLRDEFNGLGYCAVGRCVDLATLMMAVYEHDRETLGSKAPKGLLLIEGVSEQQWRTAMDSREDELQGKDLDYFSAVAVLASRAKIDAKLVALSQLPNSFNLREWMDMLIFGYALSFGFDASEFWPVQFGALGRGTETEIQHEKATGKGRLDFVLTFQEQMQETLPETILYEFDQRDDKGDLIKAQVKRAQIDVVKAAYESGLSQGQPLILWEEARMLLADYGVIPRIWAELENQSSTDKEDEEGQIEEEDKKLESKAEVEAEKQKPELESSVNAKGRMDRLMRDEMLAEPHIMRAAEVFGQEPIIEYSWPLGTRIVLSSSGDALLRRRMW